LELHALGSHVLKDFSFAVELFQLGIPGASFPIKAPRLQNSDKRVAVLPFNDMSKGQDLDYMGQGIAEELIVALGRVPGLRVVSQSISLSLKEASEDIEEIGRKLKTDAIVSGTLRSENGHVRISAELIDTDSGYNLWSGKFDQSRNGIVEIEDTITREIIRALGLEKYSKDTSVSSRQSPVAEAYDFYLRGRRFYLQFSTREMELALAMFKKAIDLDEDYALAFAGLADCYSYQYQHKWKAKKILKKADKASKKAVSRAPGLAEVYVSRGIVLSLQGEMDEAELAFDKAIELDPTIYLGWYHYARTCFVQGKLEKAAILFQQANRVEPEDYQSIFLAAQSYFDLECFELAKELRIKGVSKAKEYLELNPGNTRALYMAANALVFLGEREESLSFVQRALLLEPHDSMTLYNVGCVYALLGMKEEALSCLERAYKAGLTLLGWYENDSNLDNIRGEERFQMLLERVRNHAE
jgi:TolB-like protein/Tfp pilus assembly protein PilF